MLTEIVEARNNDLEIETFVTFEISRAELNFCYIRSGDDIMCMYTNLDANRRGSPHDLVIQTFVTFGMLRAELNFSDIRNGEGTMCPYMNFDGNHRGSPWITLNLTCT